MAAKKASKPIKTERKKPTAKSRTQPKKSRTPAAKAGGARRAGKPTTVVQFQYAQLVKRLPGASAAQLAAIERHFGGALPTDYAEFLRGVNGGGPEPSFVALGSIYFGIEAFYGAGAASAYYDVLQASQRVSTNARRTVVAVAGDGCGDHLVLLEPGDPAIYWWAHDDEGEPRRVAKSFDALLASLTVPKD
jgi:SMI1 / KNR4 family (SUKH-1)